MSEFGFLNQMEEEKKREYVQTLVRVSIGQYEEGEWRASQMPPKRESDHWVPAKAGYINKFENESLISRTYSSNQRTVYTLDSSLEEVIPELKQYEDLMDAKHRGMLHLLSNGVL